MAETPKLNQPGRTLEAIRPEGDVGAPTYVVVIMEVRERIVHRQDWVRWEDPATKAVTGGFHTFAQRERVKTKIFQGEFTERPRISALSQLMEKTTDVPPGRQRRQRPDR